MKTAVIVITLFGAFAVARDGCPMQELMKEGFEKCKESMKPSEEVIKLVVKDEGHDNKDARCLRACVAKETGLMKDAKLDMDKLESLIKNAKGIDEKLMQEIMKVARECKVTAETSKDECEVGGTYAKCFKEKMRH